MCRDPVEMKATAGAPHVHDHSGPGTGQGSTHKHAPSGPQTAPEAGPYTCPMHPEVRHEGPGSCPKCGMALEPVAPAAPAERTEWTCPMHPQIIRDGPGTCPICGMALEPRAAVQEEANPELRDMTRRFWVSVMLAVPLLGIAMSDVLPGDPVGQWLPMRMRGLVELVLATPVCLWAAWP